MLAATRLIDAIGAPHFVMENVCGVTTSPIWLKTKAFLAKQGYKTVEMVINSNDCGVPQKRECLFAVGFKMEGKVTW